MEKNENIGIYGTLDRFAKMNTSENDVRKYLCLFDERTRANILRYVSLMGYSSLEDKVISSIEKLRDEKQVAFKRAVHLGRYEEFLSNLSLMQKRILEIEMGLVNRIDLSGMDAIYYQLIEEAIDADISRMEEKERLYHETTGFKF